MPQESMIGGNFAGWEVARRKNLTREPTPAMRRLVASRVGSFSSTRTAIRCFGRHMLSETSAARMVISTAGSPEEAARIGRELVERGLAGCVSRLPGLISVYRWQGAVEEAEEVLLLIKTSEERLAALEAALRELHPYEVPEFLVLSVSAGSAAYLEWLFSSVTRDKMPKDDNG